MFHALKNIFVFVAATLETFEVHFSHKTEQNFKTIYIFFIHPL